MNGPLTPEKIKYPSVTSCEKFLKYYGKELFPHFKNVKKAILCFSPPACQKLKVEFNGKRKKALGITFDFYKKTQTVVLSHFGIGAPASVVCLEFLKTLGTKNILSLGWAGSFADDLSLGEFVFIEKALRDEGTSYHYNNSSHLFVKNTNKTLLKNFFAKPVFCWTTDAPYRETKYEIKKWKKKGVSCVEMEASAIMTVGQYYGLSVLCFAVVSDILKDTGWEMGFSNKLIHQNFYKHLKSLLTY